MFYEVHLGLGNQKALENDGKNADLIKKVQGFPNLWEVIQKADF